MVDRGIVGFGCGQRVGYAGNYIFLKICHCLRVLLYFTLYRGQNLGFGLLRLGDDLLGACYERLGLLAVFQTGGVDLHVEACSPMTALRIARAPTPASDTELGLPSSAMARTMSNALNEVSIVRRGTSVA